MTLETLITFLTIENNNMDNYIVIFEYRVMVTAFAILAMFDFLHAEANPGGGRGRQTSGSS